MYGLTKLNCVVEEGGDGKEEIFYKYVSKSCIVFSLRSSFQLRCRFKRAILFVKGCIFVEIVICCFYFI